MPADRANDVRRTTVKHPTIQVENSSVVKHFSGFGRQPAWQSLPIVQEWGQARGETRRGKRHDMRDTGLPPIERWWPHLDVAHKHEILADLDAPLSSAALEAVFRLNGEFQAAEARDIRLSDREKSYIRTQVESVD
jgi:hypothetical protein